MHCPTYKVVNPNIRYPDWFADVNNGSRYDGFSYQATRGELEKDNSFFDVDDLRSEAQLSMLEQLSAQESRVQRDISAMVVLKSSDILDLYYHYTKIEGRPYLTVWGNRKTKLIKVEEVPAMTDIEKKDPTKIGIPVIKRYLRPLRHDPFGVCVPDLLEDKEKMIQLFLNLNRIKAEHEALGDLFLFDPDKVDVNNLSIPTI